MNRIFKKSSSKCTEQANNYTKKINYFNLVNILKNCSEELFEKYGFEHNSANIKTILNPASFLFKFVPCQIGKTNLEKYHYISNPVSIPDNG